MATETSFWKRCSGCKKEIDFSVPYQVCSVSTCNRKRTGMVFCSVGCWEMHLPMMRHREAYAVEKRSPSRYQWQKEQTEVQREKASPPARSAPAPSERLSPPASPSGSPSVLSAPADSTSVRRRVAAPDPAADSASIELPEVDEASLPRDVLVVASKLKKYIRARSSMNTSDGVLSILSDHLRALCKQAIRNAAKDGRKTVLDRDIPRPPID